MSNLELRVRPASGEDAADVARVFIAAWHDTYPGVLPDALLRAMTPKGQTSRWQAAIQAARRSQGREAVLVADSRYGIIGMTSLGPAHDHDLGYAGEVYTLYVDPAHYGEGVGRALLQGAFAALRQAGLSSALIWAHAKNPARFFYQAMGGRLIAERADELMGEPCPEVAFGWNVLETARTSERPTP